MRLTIAIITTLLTLLTTVTYAQEIKTLKGITVDGKSNRIPGVNVLIMGTPTGTVTDNCGEFSIPFEKDSLTFFFHGLSYDDISHLIVLTQKDVVGKVILFQLGHLKQEPKNDACKKPVDKKLKRFVLE